MNYKKLLLAVTAILLSVTFSANAKQADTIKRYIKIPAGYLLVLRQGDDINSQLESFAKAENIPSANFTGMGFVNVTFGFFDSAKKKFNPRTFNDVELGSFTGSIAWQESKPSIHMHGIVAGDDFKAYGGHILKGTVGTGSLEIMVTVHDKKLERVFEKELGANVLHLDVQK